MECVRVSINAQLSAAAEQILCVLDRQHAGVAVELDVRVFVLERLSAVGEFICNLFLEEMETLRNTQLHTAGMCC